VLKSRLGRVAGEPELAAELGMSLEAFQHLLGELRGLDLASLQLESADSKFEKDVLGYRPGSADKNPFAQCLQDEMNSLVADALGDLSEKERQVVTLYYLEELTMKEVGAVVGLKESRVSQIHSVALIRLRARMEEILLTRMKNSPKVPAPAPISALNESRIGAACKRAGTRCPDLCLIETCAVLALPSRSTIDTGSASPCT
jgi:RNA polymerase sigma factor FliA